MSLRIHQLSLNAVRSVAPIIARVQRRDAKLADQMRRAAQSVHLNIAEAEGLSDGNQRTRFGTARGSARETIAALELAQAFGYVVDVADAVDNFDHVAATLYRLCR